jgi:biotin carboxyl carrier protein
MFNNYKVNEELLSFDQVQKTTNTVHLTADNKKVRVQLLKQIGAKLYLEVQIDEASPTQIVVDVAQKAKNNVFRMALSGQEIELKALQDANDDSDSNAGYAAPMTARVVEVLVEDGQEVTVGERLVVLEAMKLQIDIKAKSAQTIEKILVSEGSQVQQGDLLLIMEEEEEEEETE